ncbi:kinesin, putative [Entamoeba histolytica HM-1:IMSS-B]|uniref:Kinesin, putative n=6 Tax=Entamoeba histolytica TaxID=5759 RepID=C4M983_ENTH1|nr:kinesin, putative [Entamoeba histolytica HM-1:IMSS]EMD43655.1 bipolar kinesin, putative [Entamoeba histolytica KU27]EMH76180.1 kinesin, putative [Entamoeba histolytica HM-1:IMSS-B]EMS14308.1 bipolar kinesin, putative [Entamoeba histolytica HM-3:IMSS]ENY64344.1 bipolar kinesin, putative [Entamoeba histolytica HM-1:IMSS-A]GAT98209.1 kinesin putative [Entamoeba histolytica]|eukprot:XP_649446.1 kinesin, putative [Entamoeba histolytica HM-1:IMSS]
MNIKVYVRCRPGKENEHIANIQMDNQNLIVSGKKYEFDQVFSSQVNQNQFCDSALEGFIGKVIDGYNCTFFAYGQTGTGKTYTMEGEEENEGVIPRVINELFMTLEKRGLRYRMRVTHVEIYNEKVYDLLSDERKELAIKERKEGNGASPESATELTVTKENVHQILAKSSGQRRTAATDINTNSSRSHCIFTVTVQIIRDSDFEGDFVVPGRIHCVDLAGSENSKRAGIIGDKVKQLEGMAINQSLLALNRVIIGVSKGDSYIPFRSSPLTRILQDALGGASITAMVATISPAQEDLEETLSTLEYAKRVKTIKNTPKQNASVRKDIFLQKKLDKIINLKKLITEGKRNEKPLTEEEIEILQMEVAKVNQQNLEMQALFAQAKGEVSAAQDQLKSAMNYIHLKRQNEIELKTMLGKVVKSIEILTKQSRKLEDIYERNNEKIKQNDDIIKQIQENENEIEKKITEQIEEEKKEIQMSWNVIENKIEESDKKSIIEGINFEEFNQQWIYKDTLGRMEIFCKEGLKQEKENKENVIKILKEKENINEEFQEKLKTIEDIEQKEIKEKEEEMEIVNESLKGVIEELKKKKKESQEFEEIIIQNEVKRNEKRKEMIKSLNENIQKQINENKKILIQSIENMGNEINNTLDEWVISDNQIIDEHLIEKDKRNIKYKEILNQQIINLKEINQIIIQKQQNREVIQQNTIHQLQLLIQQIKILINSFKDQSNIQIIKINDENDLFISLSKQYIKEIIQTIELGIGENGIVGALISQINEIINRMKQKTFLTKEVQNECLIIKEKLNEIKRKLLSEINNINELTLIELNSLETPHIQPVTVPLFTVTNKLSEVPSFGLRLSEKLKHLDTL